MPRLYPRSQCSTPHCSKNRTDQKQVNSVCFISNVCLAWFSLNLTIFTLWSSWLGWLLSTSLINSHFGVYKTWTIEVNNMNISSVWNQTHLVTFHALNIDIICNLILCSSQENQAYARASYNLSSFTCELSISILHVPVELSNGPCSSHYKGQGQARD